jgi:hypothetical protein
MYSKAPDVIIDNRKMSMELSILSNKIKLMIAPNPYTGQYGPKR